MARTTEDLLKDRTLFSEEQEQAIQKAVAKEVKKYTKEDEEESKRK